MHLNTLMNFLRYTYMGTEKLPIIKLSKKSQVHFPTVFFSQWSLYPKEKEYHKSIYSLLGYGILIESTKNTRRIDST